MTYQSIVPYTSVFIDADWKDFAHAARECVVQSGDRKSLIKEIEKMWTNDQNPNFVLPCLSVRSGLDLYLKVKQFPAGSEVIMSAINIPDMVQIVRHHGLRILSLDIDLETTSPKIELLESLISKKTVAILLAHIYGKLFDMEPFVCVAKRHGLCIIEDCAEGFAGLQYLGHPKSDISLFSFGVIKFYTAFGGAILKIRSEDIFSKMHQQQNRQSVQSNRAFLQKVIKYSFIYVLLNCPRFIKPGMYLTRAVGLDHQQLVVKMLRGFPEDLISRIQYRPSTPLLHMMCKRVQGFSEADFNLSRMKGEYVSQRLPENITIVGVKAEVNNYWLYPIIVNNPDSFVRTLNSLGVDAYRGATQLNIIEPDNGNDDLYMKYLTSPNVMHHYPHEAKYLIDHVVYLPINKTMPFCELDRICAAVQKAMMLEGKDGTKISVKLQGKDGAKINLKLQSKL